jgi:hypothetical protein
LGRVSLAAALLASGACVAAHRHITTNEGSAESNLRQQLRAHFQQIEQNCAKLRQYSVIFIRQERRGLFNVMSPREHIQTIFRREPFSVHMLWLDPDVKYGESTYVADQDQNRVRFIARKGLFGLPPGIARVDLQTPVTWGESRYPLSDFGVERMMQRTLASLAKGGDEVQVSDLGETRVDEITQPLHGYQFLFPSWQFKAPLQELHIDPKTDLPVALFIKSTSGDLDALYIYKDLTPLASVDDSEFLLAPERKPPAVSPQ